MRTRYSDGRPVVAYSLCDAGGRPICERKAEQVFYAASTVKLAVMLAAMLAVDAGMLTLTESLVCTRRFPSGVAGAPGFAMAPEDADRDFPEEGARTSVSEMLGMMVSNSSNEATDVLVGRIGLPAVSDAIRASGATGMRMERLFGDVAAEDAGSTNEVSARDLTKLMRCIVRGELTTRPSTELMRALLTRQRHPRITSAVPAGSLWGSKSGDVPGIEHDVVFVGDPDLPEGAAGCVRYLAVCTRGYEPAQGREAIASIASALLTSPR